MQGVVSITVKDIDIRLSGEGVQYFLMKCLWKIFRASINRFVLFHRE